MGKLTTRLHESLLSKINQQIMERETGIEPASLAWKARVLPLNYSRTTPLPEPLDSIRLAIYFCLVEEAGFEPA